MIDPRELSVQDQELAARCLTASEKGPFFPECEFQTLFGVTRSVLAEVRVKWPSVDASDQNVQCAVMNSLSNLLGYPHGYSLNEFLGASREEVRALLDRMLRP